MLPLPHLPQDQLRKYCNARHLCDLLITPLSAWTHLFSDTGRIPIAQLMAACLPALAINGNHSEQPPLAPGPPLPSGGPLSDHGVLRCEGARPPPPAGTDPIQWSPTRPAPLPTCGADSIIWVEERAEHSQALWRKPDATRKPGSPGSTLGNRKRIRGRCTLLTLSQGLHTAPSNQF